MKINAPVAGHFDAIRRYNELDMLVFCYHHFMIANDYERKSPIAGMLQEQPDSSYLFDQLFHSYVYCITNFTVKLN